MSRASIRLTASRLGRARCARVLDTSAVHISGQALLTDIFQSCEKVEGCWPEGVILLEEAVPVGGPATDVGRADWHTKDIGCDSRRRATGEDIRVRGAGREILEQLGSIGDKVLVEDGWKCRTSATIGNCFGLAGTFQHTTSPADSSEALGQWTLN
jgi:hypothetical protein